MKFIKLNRVAHKWAGAFLSFFLLIFSLTGIFLIHKKNFPSLKEMKVPGTFIPGWYAKEMRKKGSEVEAIAIKAEERSNSSLFVGAKAGLNVRKGNTWKRVRPFGGIEVKALLLTEQRWFVGTKKGLYESLDKGKSWKMVKRGALTERKWLDVKAIEQSPLDDRLIWIGSKNGIYRSINEGADWEQMSHILPKEREFRHVSSIAFDLNKQGRVFIGTHNGLYSYDWGAIRAIEIKGLSTIAANVEPRMSLDEYLQKLHTGKLFGGRLWFLYDLTAIAILLFIGTGLYIWVYPTLSRLKRKGKPLNR